MAHWDHLGRGPDTMEDPIFNGAFDNATGTAGLIELAKAFSALPERPARSVVFLAVAAEEQGLLGSAYYAANPGLPDSQHGGEHQHGRPERRRPDERHHGRRHGSVRAGRLPGGGRRRGRAHPAARPRAGEGVLLPLRSLQLREGRASPRSTRIPGIDHVEHGIEWTLARRADYTSNRYHKPADEFDPSWDLTGSLDDLELLFRMGYRLADSEDWPNWREDNEFRAIRDADPGRADPGVSLLGPPAALIPLTAPPPRSPKPRSAPNSP